MNQTVAKVSLRTNLNTLLAKQFIAFLLGHGTMCEKLKRLCSSFSSGLFYYMVIKGPHRVETDRRRQESLWPLRDTDEVSQVS